MSEGSLFISNWESFPRNSWGVRFGRVQTTDLRTVVLAKTKHSDLVPVVTKTHTLWFTCILCPGLPAKMYHDAGHTSFVPQNIGILLTLVFFTYVLVSSILYPINFNNTFSINTVILPAFGAVFHIPRSLSDWEFVIRTSTNGRFHRCSHSGISAYRTCSHRRLYRWLHEGFHWPISTVGQRRTWSSRCFHHIIVRLLRYGSAYNFIPKLTQIKNYIFPW